MAGFLVGSVVGVVIGFIFGRTGEKARRSYRDYGVAKTAAAKGRTVAFTEVRKAALTGLLVGAFLVAIFVGAFNMPD
ncbi:MAG TPA: hypothetical protein VF163_12655 [Micromonosporaceae bacterium]